MPSPTGIIAFSPSTPAAPSGRQNVNPQTDSGSPLQHFSFNFPNVGGVNATITTTTANLGQAQQGTINKYSNASGVAVALSPTSMDPGWTAYVTNINATGSVTITASSGTFTYGTTTGAATLVLGPGGDAVISWDGTNWTALLMGTAAGSSLALEVNSVANASQSLLNLVQGSGMLVTDLGGGSVQIAQSSSSGGGASPSKRRWSYVNIGVATPSSSGTYIGDSAFNFTSAGSPIYGFDGPYQSPSFPGAVGVYTSGSTSGNFAGINGSPIWGTGNNLLYITRAALSAITGVRFRIGVGDVGSGSTWLANDTLTSNNYAAFRFSTNASDTHFMCETGNGASVAVADSGVTPVVNTIYLFQIQFNDSIPNVVFSINGTVVATATTDLPSSSTSMRHLEGLETLTSAARTMYMSWTYIEADN